MLHDRGPPRGCFWNLLREPKIGSDGSSCSNRHVHPKLAQIGEETELRIARPTHEVPLPWPFISPYCARLQITRDR